MSRRQNAMSVASQNSGTKAKAAVALMLTFSAGIVDIVGYLAIYHSFVAHMTGNTVKLGSEIATRDWEEAAKAASIIASFVAGSVLGRSIIEAGARKHVQRVASIILLAEAVLVLLFVWTDPLLPSPAATHTAPLATVCGLLALLAAAMGLQTATLTRIGPLTIHTTFVTGMLNKFAQAASEWIFWVHDQWRNQSPLGQLVHHSGKHLAFRNATFMVAICFSYLVGAISGTWMNARWNTHALYVPVGALAISAVLDQVRPLSLEEEKDQL
jgi:uncharacterized membrane protein YoaK (UPF0700 family)